MIRAALIGAGRIASQHLACLRALEGVELVAVCDRSASLAEVAAERFGARASYADHREMLAAVEPDVVHVTTPPHTHVQLALDALDAGAHVVVEKPLGDRRDDAERLLRRAADADRFLIENYNYLFNGPILRLLELRDSADLGDVVHVEAALCLDIVGDSAFTDPNLPSPALAQPGGAIMDFLPHLASLAHAFVGAHRRVDTVWSKRATESPLPHDEMRALVESERGTASLLFSSHAQPASFQVRVLATRMRASAGLFEPRLTVERVRDVPRPLVPALNALAESGEAAAAAFRGLWGKVSGGPGSYEGLWELLRRLYKAIADGAPPPIAPETVREVNRLVWDVVEGAP